jgi:hypothetical protein
MRGFMKIVIIHSLLLACCMSVATITASISLIVKNEYKNRVTLRIADSSSNNSRLVQLAKSGQTPSFNFDDIGNMYIKSVLSPKEYSLRRQIDSIEQSVKNGIIGNGAIVEMVVAEKQPLLGWNVGVRIKQAGLNAVNIKPYLLKNLKNLVEKQDYDQVSSIITKQRQNLDMFNTGQLKAIEAASHKGADPQHYKIGIKVLDNAINNLGK